MNKSVFDVSKLPQVKEMVKEKVLVGQKNQQKTETNVDLEVSEEGLDVQQNPNDVKMAKLVAIFDKKRVGTSKKIKEFSYRLTNFQDLTLLAIELYVARQNFVEERYKTYELCAKLEKNIKVARKDSLTNLTTGNLSVKYQNEKNVYIDADTANQSYKIDIMNNHVNFLDATIKNLDNLIWGVKLRVNIEEIGKGII